MNTKITITLLTILLILVLGVSAYSIYVNIENSKSLSFLLEKNNYINSLNLENITEKDSLLTYKINMLEKEVESNADAIFGLEIRDTMNETIVLDSSTKGYNRIDTEYGYFLISLEEIKPYLDGYKLILDIGNPSTILFKGFKLNAKWGKAYNKSDWIDGKDNENLSPYGRYSKSLKVKSESFTKELKPGYWNRAELIISPAKANELGYLELSMETGAVSFVIE